MASTVLVRDLIRRVSVLLQDTAPQFERWPEQELVDWLNDAQVAITKFLPAACARVDAIRLKPGTRQSIETIAKDTDRDNFMSADQARDYGLIDKVIDKRP